MFVTGKPLKIGLVTKLNVHKLYVSTETYRDPQ